MIPITVGAVIVPCDYLVFFLLSFTQLLSGLKHSILSILKALKMSGEGMLNVSVQFLKDCSVALVS